MVIQLATRVDEKVKKAVEKVCQQKGLKISHFVEEALIDKLEEIWDVQEIENLRKEPTRSFEDVIKDLKKHGKI